MDNLFLHFGSKNPLANEKLRPPPISYGDLRLFPQVFERSFASLFLRFASRNFFLSSKRIWSILTTWLNLLRPIWLSELTFLEPSKRHVNQWGMFSYYILSLIVPSAITFVVGLFLRKVRPLFISHPINRFKELNKKSETYAKEGILPAAPDFR